MSVSGDYMLMGLDFYQTADCFQFDDFIMFIISF